MEEHKSRLVYTIYMLTFFLCGVLLFLIGFFPASYSVAEQENTVPIDRPTTLHGEKWVISSFIMRVCYLPHMLHTANLNPLLQIRTATGQLRFVHTFPYRCASQWFPQWDHHAGGPWEGLPQAEFTRGYTHCDHAEAKEYHHRHIVQFHWYST